MSQAEVPGPSPSEGPATPPPPEAPPTWAAAAPASVPGAEGFVYADVPNRIIALIIDAIILAVISLLIAIPLSIIGFSAGFMSTRFDVGQIIWGLIGLVISVGYFFWSWTTQRATVGMRLLGMQVGNAFDGKTISTDQAIRRALALWGPSTLAQFFGSAPAIGAVLGLLAFVWVIYLLYTTATSPTKQGFHDKFSNTVVVKAMRVA